MVIDFYAINNIVDGAIDLYFHRIQIDERIFDEAMKIQCDLMVTIINQSLSNIITNGQRVGNDNLIGCLLFYQKSTCVSLLLKSI